MLRLVFFALISLNLFALEIVVSKGIENKQPYSVINLLDKTSFLCEKELDKFGNTKKIICSFSKIPKANFKPFENDFFQVTPKILKNNFFLIITAKYKIYFYPIIFNLIKEDTTFKAKTDFSKRWIIVGYKDTLPFIKDVKKSEFKIDFPFSLKTDELPYVGGLDLKGNPVHIKNPQDVKAYVRVKNLYKDKKYDACIDSCDEILDMYPNTLFKSELLFYKIKSFFQLKSYEAVIEASKDFLREYSSSENVPEVLLLTAASYYKNGQYTDADYFFDRLFSEHQDSKWTKIGYIYKGDMAFDSGEDSKAEKFYKKALKETKDIDIAAKAAFKLANLYIQNGKYDKAKIYINKILKAKDDYFIHNYPEAKEMMFTLAESEKYLDAANIDEAILKYMHVKNDDYESNLKYLGVWLAKTSQKKRAIKALDRYLKEFNDGLFVSEVEKTRDELFFDTADTNSTKLIDKYNKLIETYKNGVIGQKALYEKAKLMLKKKMYSDILQIKDKILSLDDTIFKDKDEIIKKAALGLMENALENSQCQVVLDIQSDYNISVSSKWDYGLYECFLQAADFVKAKKIAKRNLNTKDIQQKKKWLYRYIKVDFETGNYSEVISASKDLLALVDNINKSEYKDIYRILFDAYDRVGDFDNMITTIQKIEELFGLSYKDIDRYVAMINVGVAKKDDNIIIKYGKKLYDLQNRIKSYAQSPFIEFSLYQAYMNKQEYKKALEVISSLDKLKLKPKVRARQKYLKGAVLDKLWRDDEAIKAYKEAIKADENSAWAKLAKSALEIYK